MYLEVGLNQSKVGSIFPKELGVEDFPWEEDSSSLILKEIYLLVDRYVATGIWTVEDFKKFRYVLSRTKISDFSEYQNFVRYLLRDIEGLPFLAKNLNQTLDLHLFDVREKVVEVDPETKKKKREYYRLTERI